ncbi:MAG: hypothetical protein ACK5XL_15395, partial [Cyclobacteriaceae bacterium]
TSHALHSRALLKIKTIASKLYNLPAGRQAVRLDARLTNLQYEAVNPQTSVCDGMCATARWDG